VELVPRQGGDLVRYDHRDPRVVEEQGDRAAKAVVQMGGDGNPMVLAVDVVDQRGGQLQTPPVVPHQGSRHPEKRSERANRRSEDPGRIHRS
jgi:hypothetical protein